MSLAGRGAIRRAAGLLSRPLPLRVRQNLVVWAERGKLPGGFELSMGMLEDLRRRDPDTLHRFLWSNHLAYAAHYEVTRKFGSENINPTRHLLFSDMVDYFRARGVDPQEHVRSVFEVGCSMGYLLRHIEEEVFPNATILHGLDIDGHAIETGSAHLRRLNSTVKLFAVDMSLAGNTMGDQLYDVVLCCGVLMYVNNAKAESVIQAMFSHARHLVGLICLAPPESEAAGKPASPQPRESDGAYIHDVTRMIRQAGGTVVSSKWVGTETSKSSPSHVILAEPPSGNAR